MAEIALEDQFQDILGKAQRGLAFADSEIAERCAVSAEEWKSLRGGAWNEAVARRVAPLLRLNADALTTIALGAWKPRAVRLDGLAMFTTPFDDMMVNSYLVWDPQSGAAAAFDSGSDAGAMLEFLKAKNLSLTAIFLTHTHGDHIFDLDHIVEKTGASAFVSRLENFSHAENFDAGKIFEIGALKIETRQTIGHSAGGVTYVVRGLAAPVAVVGDALFASSMGGGMVSYADALRTNCEELFTLSDETVVAPGHGPLTTIGEERAHNPFFAK